MSEVKRCSDSELEQYLADGIAKLQADYDSLRAELDAELAALRAENARLTASRQVAIQAGFGLAEKLDAIRAELAALKAVPDGVEVVGYRARFLKEPGVWMTEWDRPIPEDRNPAAEYQLLYAAPAPLRQPVAGERCEKLRAIHSMILNALDRDAAEGKQARGEMAAELRAALSAPAAGQDVSALVRFTEQMARQNGEPYFKRLAKAALAAHKAGG